MKHLLFSLWIVLFFPCVLLSQEINPQFAIDLLTGKTQSVANPCSGPPGSGCENIVPAMSTAQRLDPPQPEIHMTPNDPMGYARQQIPRYPQSYQNQEFYQQQQVYYAHILAWQNQQRLALEAIQLFGKDLSYAEKKRQQQLQKEYERLQKKGEQGLPGERAGDPAGDLVSSPPLPPKTQQDSIVLQETGQMRIYAEGTWQDIPQSSQSDTKTVTKLDGYEGEATGMTAQQAFIVRMRELDILEHQSDQRSQFYHTLTMLCVKLLSGIVLSIFIIRGMRYLIFHDIAKNT